MHKPNVHVYPESKSSSYIVGKLGATKNVMGGVNFSAWYNLLWDKLLNMRMAGGQYGEAV